jgi:hypothetical protein
VSSCLHLLEADCDQYFSEQVELDDVLQFVMGRLPKQRLYSKVASLYQPASLDRQKEGTLEIHPQEHMPSKQASVGSLYQMGLDTLQEPRSNLLQEPKSDPPQEPKSDPPQEPSPDHPHEPKPDRPHEPSQDHPHEPKPDPPQKPKRDPPQHSKQDLPPTAETDEPAKEELTMPSISVPPDMPEEEVEQKLIELLEVIRSHKEGRLKAQDFDSRIQQIISQVGEEAARLSQDKQSLKMRLLIQFITEYRKARQQQQKKYFTTKPLVLRALPTPPPRPAKAPPVRNDVGDEYTYTRRGPPKVTKMKAGWGTNTSPSVLSSRYAPIRRHKSKPVVKEQSRWIGGLKYHEDFEDDWGVGRSKTPV